MCDLEDRPDGLVFLLSIMRCGFSVFHLIGELEQSVFDIFETIRRWLAIAGCATDWWHDVKSVEE